MTGPLMMRVGGVLFLIAAAILTVANLGSAGDESTLWLAAPLFVVGLALVMVSRRLAAR